MLASMTNNIGKVEPVPTGGMGTTLRISLQVVCIACEFRVRSIIVRPWLMILISHRQGSSSVRHPWASATVLGIGLCRTVNRGWQGGRDGAREMDACTCLRARDGERVGGEAKVSDTAEFGWVVTICRGRASEGE